MHRHVDRARRLDLVKDIIDKLATWRFELFGTLCGFLRDCKTPNADLARELGPCWLLPPGVSLSDVPRIKDPLQYALRVEEAHTKDAMAAGDVMRFLIEESVALFGSCAVGDTTLVGMQSAGDDVVEGETSSPAAAHKFGNGGFAQSPVVSKPSNGRGSGSTGGVQQTQPRKRVEGPSGRSNGSSSGSLLATASARAETAAAVAAAAVATAHGDGDDLDEEDTVHLPESQVDAATTTTVSTSRAFFPDSPAAAAPIAPTTASNKPSSLSSNVVEKNPAAPVVIAPIVALPRDSPPAKKKIVNITPSAVAETNSSIPKTTAMPRIDENATTTTPTTPNVGIVAPVAVAAVPPPLPPSVPAGRRIKRTNDAPLPGGDVDDDDDDDDSSDGDDHVPPTVASKPKVVDSFTATAQLNHDAPKQPSSSVNDTASSTLPMNSGVAGAAPAAVITPSTTVPPVKPRGNYTSAALAATLPSLPPVVSPSSQPALKVTSTAKKPAPRGGPLLTELTPTTAEEAKRHVVATIKPITSPSALGNANLKPSLVPPPPPAPAVTVPLTGPPPIIDNNNNNNKAVSTISRKIVVVPQPSTSYRTPPRDSEELARYHRMIKAGLRQGAVENAMIRDGYNPAAVFDDPINNPASSTSWRVTVDSSATPPLTQLPPASNKNNGETTSPRTGGGTLFTELRQRRQARGDGAEQPPPATLVSAAAVAPPASMVVSSITAPPPPPPKHPLDGKKPMDKPQPPPPVVKPEVNKKLPPPPPGGPSPSEKQRAIQRSISMGPTTTTTNTGATTTNGTTTTPPSKPTNAVMAAPPPAAKPTIDRSQSMGSGTASTDLPTPMPMSASSNMPVIAKTGKLVIVDASATSGARPAPRPPGPAPSERRGQQQKGIVIVEGSSLPGGGGGAPPPPPIGLSPSERKMLAQTPRDVDVPPPPAVAQAVKAVAPTAATTKKAAAIQRSKSLGVGGNANASASPVVPPKPLPKETSAKIEKLTKLLEPPPGLAGIGPPPGSNATSTGAKSLIARTLSRSGSPPPAALVEAAVAEVNAPKNAASLQRSGSRTLIVPPPPAPETIPPSNIALAKRERGHVHLVEGEWRTVFSEEHGIDFWWNDTSKESKWLLPSEEHDRQTIHPGYRSEVSKVKDFKKAQEDQYAEFAALAEMQAAAASSSKSSSSHNTVMSQTKARCKFNFTPANPTTNVHEMAIQVGDVIAVIDQGADGWWEGIKEKDGKKGLFPSGYVELLG